MLRREQVHGIYASLLTAFHPEGSLHETLNRENIRKLVAVGVHGIYTTMSAGEVQSITFEEHRRLCQILAEEAGGKVVTIAGCTSPSTAEAIRRVRVAQELGIDAVANALPYFVALRKAECYRYFQDLAESCPAIGIFHYQTSRAGTLLDANDYGVLARIPTFLGSKQTGNDWRLFMDLRRRTPELAHLPVDPWLVPAMMIGAQGCWSAVAVQNPPYILQMYQLASQQRWSEALAMQQQLNAFTEEVLVPLTKLGYLDPVIDKATANICGFIQVGDPRQPFLPMEAAHQEQLRQAIVGRCPFMLYRRSEQ